MGHGAPQVRTGMAAADAPADSHHVWANATDLSRSWPEETTLVERDSPLGPRVGQAAAPYRDPIVGGSGPP
jgi:hypothetical protein